MAVIKFIPSNILCVRVHSNHHRDHVHSIHHSGQDHSTARDRLQLQQRAQPQQTSSYVPKDHMYVQVRIWRIRVRILCSIHGRVLRSSHHSTAMGQLQHQQKEQRQQRAQHQLPSSCVPKDHSVHSRSVRVHSHSIHGLVLHSNHHNTARGQHLGQQQQ